MAPRPIFGALMDVGLMITMFREHEVLAWRRYAAQASARPGETIALSGDVESLVIGPDRIWRLRDGHPRRLLSFCSGVTPPHDLNLSGPVFHKCTTNMQARSLCRFCPPTPIARAHRFSREYPAETDWLGSRIQVSRLGPTHIPLQQRRKIALPA